MAPVKRLRWSLSLLGREIKSSDGFLGASTSHASAPAVAPPAAVARPDAGPSAAAARITPAVLFITVVLAVVLLVSGLLHVLRRLFIKTHRANARAEAVERQLQQLFHLHEAGAGPGLDQSAIDALPAFAYAELSGSSAKGGQRQFDCAVCLSEFADDDRLRLLPPCGHAFHVACIDTWLASTSTCPLCRTVLSARALAAAADASAEPDIEEQKMEDAPKEPVTLAGSVVLPVRLGRFKNVHGSATAAGERGASSRLDGRRCFSMASSYQYVLADDSLVVSVHWRPGDGSAAMHPGATTASGDEQGKKVCAASRGDSFSVSKIWQWRRSGGRRLPGLRGGSSSPTDDAPPWASPPNTRGTRQETDS
ncbi:hypothetical protein ACQ4PT_060459 [Festuca glaucescens]